MLPSSSSLGFLLGRCVRQLRREIKSKLQEIDSTLGWEQWIILLQLRENDGQTQQELADVLVKDKGTIARAVYQLEDADLVIRTPNPADKRQRCVFLKDRGRELGGQFLPIAQKLEGKALAQHSPAEIRAFKNILQTIYDNLKSPL